MEQIWEQLVGSARATIHEIFVFYLNLIGRIVETVFEIAANKELIDGVCVATVFLFFPLLLGFVVFGCLRSARPRE